MDIEIWAGADYLREMKCVASIRDRGKIFYIHMLETATIKNTNSNLVILYQEEPLKEYV